LFVDELDTAAAEWLPPTCTFLPRWSDQAVGGEPRDLDPQLERALVEQARSGHEQAFELLVQRHRSRVFGLALRLTGHPQDAEDVAQESFLRAWTAMPRFRADSGFGTWIYRIVINQSHNHRRRQQPLQPLPEDTEPAGTVVAAGHVPEVESAVEDRYRRHAAAAAIAELPMEHRAPLVLHHFAGCTYGETARILGITPTAAKVRVFRARRLLTERLASWR
jgi:RNA polymerase sigma-70 factor (ECF subfamily)